MDTQSLTLLMKMLGALSIVLGILLAVNYSVRRWGGNLFKERALAGTMISVVATKEILPKKYISVVRIRGNEFVLGISDAGINLLAPLSREGGHGAQSKGPQKSPGSETS